MDILVGQEWMMVKDVNVHTPVPFTNIVLKSLQHVSKVSDNKSLTIHALVLIVSSHELCVQKSTVRLIPLNYLLKTQKCHKSAYIFCKTVM